MTPNEVIYQIHQSKPLSKIWRDLTETQKREILKECENAVAKEIEKIVSEVIEGQRRLF